MLYNRNNDKSLDMELFREPTCAYRGAPFWSWNCKLDNGKLGRQIERLKEMGFGGFQMHSRTGMRTEYLGKDFMDSVGYCCERAKDEDMLAWLYDEDRWPSGSAGGIVTKDPQYRIRGLVLRTSDTGETDSREEALRTGGVYFVAAYDVILSADGRLESYRRIDRGADAAGTKWYAFCYPNKPTGWYNNSTYSDLLSKSAIDRFIEVTHETYKATCGEDFGKTVPAIFFDEPMHSEAAALPEPFSKNDVITAWTPMLPESFRNANGYDILDRLPEVFWSDGNAPKVRYDFHNHVAGLFCTNFVENIADWCKKNNIYCTGHFLFEENMPNIVRMTGDIMRCYRKMDIPGIDVLSTGVQIITALQARSVAHQYGREGVLSELYGATNWDFDFRGHKFSGDWQAAMGVTVRVHHLAYLSMEGDCKRDFPASINYQSPWYKDYPLIENHFARLNTALTRGTPIVHAAILHPGESMWLAWGTDSEYAAERSHISGSFNDAMNSLIYAHIDTDLLCEELLPELCESPSCPLRAGKMSYNAVVIPYMLTIRKSTVGILTEFVQAGGRLIFTSGCPEYTDCGDSSDIKALYGISVHGGAVGALADLRDVSIATKSGEDDSFVYQLRQDNDCRWLFAAHIKLKYNVIDIAEPYELKISVTGEYTPTLYNTSTGETEAVDYEIVGGRTNIYVMTGMYDSFLYRLDASDMKSVSRVKPAGEAVQPDKIIEYLPALPYTLDEPNVLLLDLAEYSFDDGEWNPLDEILRINDSFKQKLNFINNGTQPWALPDTGKPVHKLSLRYTVNSAIDIDGAEFAFEYIESCESVKLNGEALDVTPDGYYVDESIHKIKLPKLSKGVSIIEVVLPFDNRTYAEPAYLLGQFGVELYGSEALLTALPEKLGFSDITGQKLPFYGSNITYNYEFEAADCDLVISTNFYRGAAVKLLLDGEVMGYTAFPPYKLKLKGVEAGVHTLGIRYLGCRYNTFAALHNLDESFWTAEPKNWRRKGNSFTYSYNLKRFGILKSPVIEIYPAK